MSSVRLDPSVIAAVDGLRDDAAAHRVHRRRLSTRSRRAYRPGAGMSEAFGSWLESLLGRFGLVVYDSSEPAAKAAGRRGLHAGTGVTRADHDARRRAGARADRRRLSRAGRPAPGQRRAVQARRHPPDGALPRGRVRRRRRHRRRAPISSTSRVEQPGAVQPERPAAADRPGHALPDLLLRGRPERTGLPRAAAADLRALRRAAAAVRPAGERDAARFGGGEVPGEVRRRARDAAGRQRGGAQPPARAPAARGRSRTRSTDVSRAVEDGHGDAWSRRCPPIDPTLAGAAQVVARADAARPAHAPRARSSTPPSGATRRCAGSSPASARRRFPTAIRRNGRSGSSTS